MLKEKIQKDLNSALKEKKELEVSVLRLLLSAIFNKEKEKRYKLSKEKPELKEEELEKESELTDEKVIDVISSEIKKRKESILEFEKGKRPELVEKEKKELEILEKYLPEQLSDDELKELVKQTKIKIKAEGPSDFGKLMGAVMKETKGRADGLKVKQMVEETLKTM